jgi:hypothetical protein
MFFHLFSNAKTTDVSVLINMANSQIIYKDMLSAVSTTKVVYPGAKHGHRAESVSIEVGINNS